MTLRGAPRLLVLIGSGETAPQMARVHRSIVKRLAGPNGAASDVSAAVIDTPFGFQENADELSAHLVDHFGRRLGMRTSLASLRRSDGEILDRELALSRVRDADFVFSGPGSPSYAVRHWRAMAMGELFATKLATGGALVLASAAALTIGRMALPVYEIYKAGEDPYWLAGLDVLGTIGIHAAVVPHFDNHDGSGHDTRYCFLGERRLRALEELLPGDVWILGIDEHTALVIDLDQEAAAVHGRGSVTLRRRHGSRMLPSGTQIPLADLRAVAADASAEGSARRAGAESGADIPPASAADGGAAALARRTLELEERAERLSDRAAQSDALVDTLVDLRREARDRGDYEAADAIRDRLAALGIELRDNPDGSTDH